MHQTARCFLFGRKNTIKIIALVKGKQVFNSLGISIMEHAVENKFEEDYLLEEEDRLVCYGKYKDFMDFWKAL